MILHFNDGRIILMHDYLSDFTEEYPGYSAEDFPHELDDATDELP